MENTIVRDALVEVSDIYPIMVLPPSREDPTDHIPYAIIARLTGDHDPNNHYPQDIVYAIRDQLDIGPYHISYQAPPNYVIYLDEPLTQMRILSNPVLDVGHSHLEMVPWSKEHEWARIPWITAHSPQILVDPFTLLPNATSKSPSTGSEKLKDNFAANVPSGYDLKTPDYSYLLIAELKELYANKAQIISECAKISKEMLDMREELCVLIEELPCIICNCTSHSGNTDFISAVISRLLNISTRTQILNSFPPALTERKIVPLELDAFTNAPMHTELPISSTYTARLKIIYDVAVQKVFNTKPIVETIQTGEKRFETYVTIGEWTHLHCGGFKKTAVQQEAAAIFFSLKHITHVIGYNIVDLNYTTLRTMIDHMDTWNAQLNIFHFSAAYALAETRDIYEQLSELDVVHFDRCNCLHTAAAKLLMMTKDHLSTLIDKSRMFMKLKGNYHSTWNKSDSMLLRHWNWHASARPSNPLPS